MMDHGSDRSSQVCFQQLSGSDLGWIGRVTASCDALPMRYWGGGPPNQASKVMMKGTSAAQTTGEVGWRAAATLCASCTPGGASHHLPACVGHSPWFQLAGFTPYNPLTLIRPWLGCFHRPNVGRAGMLRLLQAARHVSMMGRLGGSHRATPLCSCAVGVRRAQHDGVVHRKTKAMPASIVNRSGGGGDWQPRLHRAAGCVLAGRAGPRWLQDPLRRLPRLVDSVAPSK